MVLEPAPGYSPVRLAILASSTVDHLLPGIRVAGLRRRLLMDIYVGAYSQYRQELMDRASALYRFAPQVILLSLTAREAIAGIAITATAGGVNEAIARSVAEMRLLWRKAREALNATVVQQTCLDIADPLFGSLDRQVPAAPARLVAQLNDRVSEAAATDGVLLFDIDHASKTAGRDAWFDRARWFQAKQEIMPEAAPLYGELLARIIGAAQGLSKKCLVLDLDNTLWHGVIGDDGLDGIVLGEGSALGEAHLAVQRYAKQLRDRGIILAVCSKNDMATVENVFQNHPEMVLRRSDFAAFVANWNDKAENLKTIAEQLNLGIDSLVFFDDNPAERARIRHALPMVAVPELPEDVADYVKCLASAGYFESVAFTSDDRQRGAQYAANAAREELRGSAESVDEFLKGLEMSVESGPFTTVDLARVTQLINKTNQFNPTTRRYTLDEVGRFAREQENLTLQFRLSDRFGDNGLVSAMILLPDLDQPGALAIDTWVMSCRVFGRQLEREAMNIAIEAAYRRGASAIRAEYIPTPKNGVVSKLYEGLGFTRIPPTAPPTGATMWMIKLAEYTHRQTHIARITH
jgi:FkbH-like protein